MASATMTIRLINKVGLHVRPAALFVRTANTFESKILIQKGEKEVDAKSILGVLSLGAEYGSVITIKALGEDEEESIKKLVELIENKFYEDSEEEIGKNQ